jgi:hypothetical protein
MPHKRILLSLWVNNESIFFTDLWDITFTTLKTWLWRQISAHCRVFCTFYKIFVISTQYLKFYHN